MDAKLPPPLCRVLQEKAPFWQCTRLILHEGDCWFSATTLTRGEWDVWHLRFAHTLSAAEANRGVTAYRAHLDRGFDEAPSFLKNPRMETSNG